MASLVLGWLAGPIIAGWLLPVFAGVSGPWSVLSAYTVAAVMAFVLLTTLHMVVGLLVPKMIATQRAEPTALLLAGRWRSSAGSSACGGRWPLGEAIVRRLGLLPTSGHDLVHTEEELRLLVTASQEGGVLEATEEEMLHKVFSFADIEARQIMVPRTEIAGVRADMTLREFSAYVANERLHTRFPVYEGSIDSIVGIIHLKDAILAAEQDRSVSQCDRRCDRSWWCRRASTLMSCSVSCGDATHMAVLTDEFGGTAGP
jgi:CBS domain containing-hemolysin-like protein